MSEQDAHDSQLPPSKSAVKRELREVQAFVKTLLELPTSQLAKLPLSADTRAEIVRARGLQKSALKRQLGYISKRMADEPVAEAQQMLADLQQPRALANARFHQLEQWRDRLLQGDEQLLQQLVSDYQANRQQLRNLVRNARQERDQDKPPRSARMLFQLLRDLLPEQS